MTCNSYKIIYVLIAARSRMADTISIALVKDHISELKRCFKSNVCDLTFLQKNSKVSNLSLKH